MTLQFTRNTNFVFNILYVVYNFAIFAIFSTKYVFHKFHILIFFNFKLVASYDTIYIRIFAINFLQQDIAVFHYFF